MQKITATNPLYKAMAVLFLGSGAISTAYALPPTTVLSYAINQTGSGKIGQAASLPFGGYVYLNALRSYDSNGSRSLKKKWEIVSKPSGSTVSINPNSSDAIGTYMKITPDVKGIYKIRLTTTDINGEQDDEVFTLTSANVAPLLTGIASNYTTFKHSAISLSSRGVSNTDGDTLTYSWTINSKPPASTIALGTYNGASLPLKLDRAGDYQITLTVNDGEASVSKVLTVKALMRMPVNNKLELPPGSVIYSSFVNRMVLKPDSLPVLYLINPNTFEVEQIPLPATLGQQVTRNSLVLSKNGRYAALSYNTGLSGIKDADDQKVSIIDLDTRSIIKTVTLQTRLDNDYLAISNLGILYALQYEPYQPRKNPTRIRLETRNILANTPSVLTSITVLSGAQDIRAADIHFDVADNRKQLFVSGTASAFSNAGQKINKRIFNFNFDLNSLGEPLFPTTNFQYKDRVGEFGTEPDPVTFCYRRVGISKDNGKIFTGYNFFYRPFSFDTERYVSYFPANATQHCIYSVSESPTSNQLIIVQNNYDYRILNGATTTEQGNLATTYGNSLQFDKAFYTNDNKVLFWGSYPTYFLLKHN